MLIPRTRKVTERASHGHFAFAELLVVLFNVTVFPFCSGFRCKCACIDDGDGDNNDYFKYDASLADMILF